MESDQPAVDVPHAAVEEGTRARPGRKQDRSRDAVILDAALDVLAETGYAGMTLATVAERAKAGKSTFYRRWPSKEHLVLDAVARMKQDQVDLEHLPDTGALRTDILGLFRPASVKDGERKLRVMTGLAAMLVTHPALAEAANDVIVEPWSAALRLLMRRATERHEIADTAAIDTLAQVIPEMAAYRSLIQRKPFELAFLTSLVDHVLLPALSASPPKEDQQP